MKPRKSSMGSAQSVAVVIHLVRAFHRHVDVGGLLAGQFGELGADLVEVEASHHLVEVLGQHIHLVLVLIALGEQLDLSQGLVGERVAHHEAGVAGGASQIHQTALGQKDDLVAARQGDVVHLRLDVVPLVLLEGSHIDLVVEVADVANDGLILHADQVLMADHLEVASRRHKDVHLIDHVFEANDAEAFHGGLQSADRIHFSDANGGPEAAQGLGRALAHIAVAHDQGLLASHHHIGGTLDAVDQGLTAAVEVVELALGDRVVDVDGREGQLTGFHHLIETGHTGGGFFRHAKDVGLDSGIYSITQKIML